MKIDYKDLTRALQCIREYYQRKDMGVVFSQDGLYFSLKGQST